MSKHRGIRSRLIARLSQWERTRPNDDLRYRLLSAIGRMWPGRERNSHAVIRDRIRALLRNRRGEIVSYLTIGAFDGKTGDPLFPFIRRGGWRGGLVEPHPTSFAKLLQTYKDIPHQWFEHAAVADLDGEVDLFCSEIDGRPAWREQTFSLSKAIHARASRVTEDQVFSLRVPAKTLATLFSEYRIDSLDVFLLDAEGSDFKIMCQLLKTDVRPRLIIYESAFLVAGEKTRLGALLEEEGYQLTHTALDTIASRAM